MTPMWRQRDGLCRSRQVDGWIFLGASCGKVRGQPAFSREFLIREKPQKFLRQNGSSLRAASRGTGAPGEAPLVNLSFKARDGRIYGSALPNADCPPQRGPECGGSAQIAGTTDVPDPHCGQAPSPLRDQIHEHLLYLEIRIWLDAHFTFFLVVCALPAGEAEGQDNSQHPAAGANIQNQEPE